jgi:two-component system nitrogen regulation response regulator GlnG
MADILLVDDQDRFAQLLPKAIPEHRFLGPARNWTEARTLLRQERGRIDLVLLDVHFDIPAEDLVGFQEGMSAKAVESLRRDQGLHILKVLRREHPDLPVVVLTSRESGALQQLGADEEYTTFLDDDDLDAQVLRAQIETMVAARRGDDADGAVFWGHGLSMQRLRQRLQILARGRLPVVLLGPTGTGKSLLARHVVHARSGRDGRFVAVDLATLPTDLMAAHLFGVVRGAYEAADGGTLFLDEVGNLSADAQKMLLSVLQDGVVTRLGDLRERPVDVKLVVATNEDLAARVREGTFRADLYMRLNPATALTLPSLVERQLDWAKLVSFVVEQALARPYLRDLADEYARGVDRPLRRIRAHVGSGTPDRRAHTLFLHFPERTLRRLRQHPWPGNLRELSMVVENAALFALSEAIGVEPGERPDVVVVRKKLLDDLLRGPGDEVAGASLRMEVELAPQDTLNRVAVACETQYFTHLYLQERGDFGRMATWLLGDPEAGRKVQLRFNQLGLKVRELKDQL